MKSTSNRTSGTDSRKFHKTRRVLIGLLVVVFIAGLGFFVVAWRPPVAPIATPAPGSFPADLVGKGEVLSAIGHCASTETPVGLGEPATTPVAIANAIFAGTGARVRHLPIRPQAVLEALARGR